MKTHIDIEVAGHNERTAIAYSDKIIFIPELKFLRLEPSINLTTA